MTTRIYYDDTDAGGVVYHSNYLRLCERARSDVFYDRGMSPNIDGGHFVVRHIEADFIKPAKLGDLVEVKSKVLEIKNASLKILQTVYRDDVKLFEMTGRFAYVKNDKPQKFTSDIKELLQELFNV